MGNQTSIRLSDGTTNTFAYDEWNRPKQSSFASSGSASARTVTYTYTPTGQRSQVTDSSRGATPVTYAYDNLDRTTLITQPNGNAVGYSYDARNNRTAITTTVGSVISATTYAYSNANQLSSVVAPTDPGSVHTFYTYDPAGRRTQLNLPNSDIVQYGYDNLSRLTTLKQSKNGTTTLAVYTYTLDYAGNRTGVTEGSGRTIAWGYDNTYRLTSEADSAATSITTTYTYDGVGNRTQLKVGSLTTNYQYNELDQLTTVLSGTTLTLSYSYVRGNLVQVKNSSNVVQQSYSWDSTDRMVGATVGAGSATYAYDADGRRIKVTASSVITNYLWDETSAYGDVLIETDNSNAIKTSYILGNGKLISQKRSITSTVEYFLKDGQGSVRNLTNDSGNLITGQVYNYNYDAFGNLIGNSSTPATSYLYTGQQFDALTGLYNLRARYYNPRDGRFFSQDSAQYNLKDPIELNRYSYTSNNPIIYSDPSGYNLTEYITTFVSNNKGKIVGAVSFVGRQFALELITQITSYLLMNDADRVYAEVKQYFDDNNINYPPFTVAVAKIFEIGNNEPVTYVGINNVVSPKEAEIMDGAIKYLVGKGYKVKGGENETVNSKKYKLHAEDNLQLLIEEFSGSIDPNFKLNIPGAVSHNSGVCGACVAVEGTSLFIGGFGIVRSLRNGGRLFIAGKNVSGAPNPGKVLPPPPSS